MLRILVFLAIVFLLGLGFSWIADNPGLVKITLPAQGEGLSGHEIELTLMVAVVAATSMIAGIVIIWAIGSSVWRSPEIFFPMATWQGAVIADILRFRVA